MSSTLNTPNGTLRIEREPIDVTSNLPRRNEAWTFTDANGHEHHYEGAETPTLLWVVDETYWCPDCRDNHQDGHYECRECGETITPGMKPAPMHREFIMGPASYYLDDEPITKAEADEFIARAQAAAS